jgi:hypothetical protein
MEELLERYEFAALDGGAAFAGAVFLLLDALHLLDHRRR